MPWQTIAKEKQPSLAQYCTKSNPHLHEDLPIATLQSETLKSLMHGLPVPENSEGFFLQHESDATCNLVGFDCGTARSAKSAKSAKSM